MKARSEKEMKRVLKALRKVWSKYPKRSLCTLVDSNVGDVADMDFVEYCKAIAGRENAGLPVGGTK